MAKKKVFLPKWQRFYVLPIIIGAWGMVTYVEFWGESEEKLGTVGYIILSGVMALIVVMIWLMTSGKLPAYIIEDDKDKED